MATTEIRERNEDDLAGCVRALRLVHDLDGYPMVWPADPVRWLSPRGIVAAWVVVAPETPARGGILGHVLLVESGDAGFYELARLFVAPDGRGSGLGAALTDRAAQWAAGRGRRLALEVVADEGSHAIALYERTGWRRAATSVADWTAPDGAAVVLQHYIR